MIDFFFCCKFYLIIQVEDCIGINLIFIDFEKVVGIVEFDYQDQIFFNIFVDEGLQQIVSYLIEFFEYEVKYGCFFKNFFFFQFGIGNIVNVVIGGLDNFNFCNFKVWIEVIQDIFFDFFDFGCFDFVIVIFVCFFFDGFKCFYKNWEFYKDKFFFCF